MPTIIRFILLVIVMPIATRVITHLIAKRILDKAEDKWIANYRAKHPAI
jgi:hypothetical protein